ncbi:MAG TPA: amidohydrolase family protein [Candidatus Acidoferrum sp.]|nr:amidohydrolase family protein [Candidatus Acidoferrum sp.]
MRGLWRLAERDRRRIVDISAHDVPLSRKIPALCGHLSVTPSSSRPQREEAKLPDLIEAMDRAGVSTSLVMLQDETEEFFGLAARYPGRRFGLAYFDSLSPGDGLERVRTLCHDHPDLILGVRTAMPVFHQDVRLKVFVPFYQYCLERDLPVQFHLGGTPGEAAARPTPFGVLAASYPRLRIVCLDAGGAWHPELPGFLQRFPNLYAAVEGLPGPGTDGGGGSRTCREFWRQTGSRQVMFGSNWLGRDPAYPQAVERVRSLPWRQRGNVCWRTAAHVYGARLLGDRTMPMGTSPATR